MLRRHLMQRPHFHILITFLVSIWDYVVSAFARLTGHGAARQKRDPNQLPLTSQSNSGVKAKAISKPICSQGLKSSIVEPVEGLDMHARGPYESPRNVPNSPKAIYTPKWLNAPLDAEGWRHGGYYDLELDIEQFERHTQVESLVNTPSRAVTSTEPYPNLVVEVDLMSEEFQPILSARTDQETFTACAWTSPGFNTTLPAFLEESLVQADRWPKGELGMRRGLKGAPLRTTGGRKSSFLSLPEALIPRSSGSKSSTPRSPLSSVTNLLSPAGTTTSRSSKEIELVDDLQLLFSRYDPFGCSSRSFYTPAYTPVLNGNVPEMNDFGVYMPQESAEQCNSGSKSRIRGNTYKYNEFRVNMRTTIYDASVYDVLLPLSEESPTSPTATTRRVKQWSLSRRRAMSAERKKQRAFEIVFTPPTAPASSVPSTPSIAALPTTTAEHNLLNIDRLAPSVGGSQCNYSAFQSELASESYDGSPFSLASTPAWERCHVATDKTISTEGMVKSTESPLSDTWSVEDSSSSDISISTLGALSLRSSATSVQFPTPQRPICSTCQVPAGDMSSYTPLGAVADTEQKVYQCPTRPLRAAIKPARGLGNGNGSVKHRSAPIPVRKPIQLISGTSGHGGDLFMTDHGEVGCKASTEVWPSVSDSNRKDDNGDGVEANHDGCDIKSGDGDIESLGVGVIQDNESDNLQGLFNLGCHHSPGTADDSALHCVPADSLKKLQERGIRDGGVRNVRDACRPGTGGIVDERGNRDGRPTDNFVDGDHDWEMGYQSQSQSQHSHSKRRGSRQKHERRDVDQQPTVKDDSNRLDKSSRKPIVEAHHDRSLGTSATMTEVHPAEPSLILHMASPRQGGISVVTEESGRGRKFNAPVVFDGSQTGRNAGSNASLISADGHDLDGFEELTRVARDKRPYNTGGRSGSITRMTKMPENLDGGVVCSLTAIAAGPNRSPTPRDVRMIRASKSVEHDASMVRRKGSGGVVGRLVQNWEGKMLDTEINQSTRGRKTSIESDKTQGSV